MSRVPANSAGRTTRSAPRKQAWIALVALIAAIVVGSWLPLGPALAIWFVSGISFGVFRLLQRCPACRTRVAWQRIDIFGFRVRVHTLLPPKRCEHCGHDLG